MRGLAKMHAQVGPTRWAAGASLGVASTAIGLLASVACALPAQAHTVAVVFPPWWSSGRALAAAYRVGDVVGVGARPIVLIVHSDGPRLASRLRREGAVLMMNPWGAGPCGGRIAGSKSHV